ncbi:MAG: hypothetical protein CMH55_09760 [Myxococcales bacterium]|nr:hypothetical protein [Myxococcales bacterium]
MDVLQAHARSESSICEDCFTTEFEHGSRPMISTKPPLISTTRKPMKKSKSKPVFLASSLPVRSSILPM